MTYRNTIGLFLLLDVPICLSVWTIVRNWSYHFVDGSWYVVIGHFMAVFATLEIIMFGVTLSVISFVTAVLFLLVRMKNIWAQAIVQWIEKKFPTEYDGSRFKRPT